MEPLGSHIIKILLSYTCHVKTPGPYFTLKNVSSSILGDAMDVTPDYAALVDLTGTPNVIDPSTHGFSASPLWTILYKGDEREAYSPHKSDCGR